MNAGDLQMRTAHAMSDPNKRTGHFIALHVDEMEEISRVIEPASCLWLIVWTSCHPNAMDVRSFPRRSSLMTLLWP